MSCKCHLRFSYTEDLTLIQIIADKYCQSNAIFNHLSIVRDVFTTHSNKSRYFVRISIQRRIYDPHKHPC